jgi:hypothetical protein
MPDYNPNLPTDALHVLQARAQRRLQLLDRLATGIS